MAIVTLISDWKQYDYYIGLLKGCLLSIKSPPEVIDLNHRVSSFHSIQASFILRHALETFPEGSVHLILVNQGHKADVWPVIARYRSQYIIGWDEDTLGLIFDGKPDYYLRVDDKVLIQLHEEFRESKKPLAIKPSFPELSIYPLLVEAILGGIQIEKLGDDKFDPSRQFQILPTVQKDLITGQVLYLDSYRNAISNISKELFTQTRQNRPFEILVKSNHYRLTDIVTTYHETGEAGDLVALFNSIDLLEIAILMGNAAELLGLEVGSTIKIKFHE